MMDDFGRVLSDAVGPDLAEFRDVVGLVRAAARLLVAALLGGLLGLERTIRARPAGLRTYMLVAVGSAGFVLVAERIGIHGDAFSRVIQGLLTGVGFLGAGIIFRSAEAFQARGLTTAAGIWLTSALGMAAGLGRPATALILALLALAILSPLGRLERRIKSRRHVDRQDKSV